MARITDEKILMERAIKMLPKGIPASAIKSVECDPYDGSNGGGSYWVYLADGYWCPTMGCHTIHEDTLKELKSMMAEVEIWADDPAFDDPSQGYGPAATEPEAPTQEEPATMTTQEAKTARAALIEAHAENRDNGPAAAVAALVDHIGYDAAREIVALLIVAKGEYDGRISERCRAWAYDLTGTTRGSLMARGIYYADDIHPAHMDQIGRAMMEYTPEPEPAQEATQAAPVAVRNVATDEIFEGPARTIYGVISHAVRLARYDCEPLPIFAAISDNAARVILAAAETLGAPSILATVSVDDLAAALVLGDYGDRLNDYRDSTTYICDAISEIADSATSIYYSDIADFISNHVHAVNDAIKEFGWDGCGGDLYKAGQMAEYMTIERDLYDHIEDAVMLTACDFLRYDLGLDTIPGDLADNVRDWANDADNTDRCNTICDQIREYLEVL